MSDGLPYLHPVLGAVTILGAVWAASLGFDGRTRPWRGSLATHGRIGPFVLTGMIVSWISGVGSVLLWREDLDLAASTHFRLGTAITLLICLSATSVPWMDRPVVRAVHPWLGAAALVLCGFQIFLGFGILP